MKRLLLKTIVFFPFSLILVASGCASFKGGNLPAINNWPPEVTSEKKSIVLSIQYSTIISGERRTPNQDVMDIYKERIEAAYASSGMFSTTSVEGSSADIEAQIEIIDQGDPNLVIAALSGLTFTVIPCSATDEFIIKTKYIDKSGKELGSFEKSEKINTWIEFFLIFVTPFKYPNLVGKEVIFDLNRATIIEAHTNNNIL